MSLDVSPSGELWRRTLSGIPSLFGRLVYLSSLRDPNSGQYLHFGFAQRFTEREADRILSRSHVDTFEDWLCFSLEQQMTDLESYLDALDQNRAVVIANWNRLPPFPALVPARASETQRQLFLADAEAILQSLLNSP